MKSYKILKLHIYSGTKSGDKRQSRAARGKFVAFLGKLQVISCKICDMIAAIIIRILVKIK